MAVLDCFSPQRLKSKTGPFNEPFLGFSREEVQNCAERLRNLVGGPSKDKPLLQKDYKDINHSLEQKLFKFYLHKRSSNCTMIWKSSLFKSNNEIKAQKRKNDLMNDSLCKKRRMDCDYDLYEVTSVFSPGKSCDEELSDDATWKYDKRESHLNCHNGKLPRIINSATFSTWNLSPLKHSAHVLESYPSRATSRLKSLQLRESRLKLRDEDKEKLKNDLIETLKCEMKESCHDDNGIDVKLRNLSQVIKGSTLTRNNCKYYRGGKLLKPSNCSKDVKEDCINDSLEAKPTDNSANLPSIQTPSPNLFDSLSEMILSKVRQLVASSQIYGADQMSPESVTDIVNKEGLVYLPNVGTALVTSSGQSEVVVVCFVCGSSGRSPEDKLVFCNACCEPFHRYCLAFRITESNENNWTCSRCQRGIGMVANVTTDFVVEELRKIFDDNTYQEDNFHSFKAKFKRRCAFCFKAGDLPSNLGGRLLYVGSNEWVHVNCVLWSDGVAELNDGRLVNVARTISASKSKCCVGCSKPGASLKCALRTCLKRFHFSCAMKYQCSFNKNTIYCPKHASILHRSSITSIFKVKRKIFASDPAELSTCNRSGKYVTIGSLKLIALKDRSTPQQGYKCRRRFWSTRDPKRICTYFCSVFVNKTKAFNKINHSRDRNAPISEGTGADSSTSSEEALDSDEESSLVRNLMKLKKLRMAGKTLTSEKIVQLDGSAGFDDGSDEDDDSMSFQDFSDSIRYDDPPESNVSTSSSSSLFGNHSKSPVYHNPALRFNDSRDAGIPKLLTPNKSLMSFMKVNPTPVKIFGGQVSYLGSVVAPDLQSLLKPKDSHNNTVGVSQSGVLSSHHQQSLFKAHNKVIESTEPISFSREASNQMLSFTSQITEHSAVSGCSNNNNDRIFAVSASSGQKHDSQKSAKNVQEENIKVATPNIPKTTHLAVTTTPNMPTSCINDNTKGQVPLLSSISSTKAQNLLKSNPLENNKFPNLPQMNVQISKPPPTTVQNISISAPLLKSAEHQETAFGFHGQKDAQNEPLQSAPSLMISISGNTTSETVNNTPMAVSNFNVDHSGVSTNSLCLPGQSTMNAYNSFPGFTSECQQVVSLNGTATASSSAITTGLLKPAVGFGNPEPFKNGELMFTDSEDEQEEFSLVNSRVFSDFDDFVRNFDTKTNAASMPVLRLKRCDDLLGRAKVACRTSQPASSASSKDAPTANSQLQKVPSLPIVPSSLPVFSENTSISETIHPQSMNSPGHQRSITTASLVASSAAVIHSNTISANSQTSTSKFVNLPSTFTSTFALSNSTAASKELPQNKSPSSPIVLPTSFPFQPPRPPIQSPTSSMTSFEIGSSGKNPLHQALRSLPNEPSNNNSSSKSIFSKPSANNESNKKSHDVTISSSSSGYQKAVVFEIKSSDGFSCSGSSAEEAWSKVKSELDSVRHKLCLKPISLGGMRGVTFFGLDHPVIINLIQNRTQRKIDQSSQGIDPQPDVLEEVEEGCARFKQFQQRKPLDLFHFLLSEHRRTIKTVREQGDIGHDPARAKPGISGIDLPLSTRFRNMQALSSVSTVVQRSSIHGRGLFAMRDIENGEMVIEYCGQIIRSTLTDARERMYESKGIGCYMFRVDDSRVVDATMRGNAARFINHSCDPNCSSKIVQVDGLKHIVICATRTIRKGEELTYNYKFPIEEGNKIPCKCGSRKCKKFMN